MKRVSARIGIGVAAAALGCASGPGPGERVASTQAAIRAAQEVGAQRVPAATLHLQLAKEQSDYAAELYLMESGGSNPRRPTHTRDLSEGEPAWSPDGTRIAYARQGEGFTGIEAIVA